MKRMERTIEKLYQGCADLIDSKVRECIQKNEDYKVTYKGDVMMLTPEQLKNECLHVQLINKPAHGGKPYRLYSYKWNPKKVEL
jgi:hypothetical protein